MTDPTMLPPMGEHGETCQSCRWWQPGMDGWGPCQKVHEADALFYPDSPAGGLMTHQDFHCSQYEPAMVRQGGPGVRTPQQSR